MGDTLTRRQKGVVRRLNKNLAVAESYLDWRALAAEHDRLSGAEDWRHNDSSSSYDYRNIASRLENLRQLRNSGDDDGLLFALNEGIHGNMGGMGNSALHSKAKCGTKFLIERYVREIADSLRHLSPSRQKTIPVDELVDFYQRASHCYGRSAIMLSGGGTLGYFHLGVLKTLIEQKLLPTVISGASAGSFVAAIVGTRTDDEFLQLFESGEIFTALTQSNDELDISLGAMQNFDIELVKEGMARMIPDMTFVEAYRKTGRSINISVSPAEPRQASRLLNHIASPNVTIRSAVLASCALPGVFKPVMLEARNADNELQAYLPSRRWIDGSFSHDLPAKRLARLYGVNHFIVSQVMPVIGSEKTQRPIITQLAVDAYVAASKQVMRGSLDFLQRRAGVGANTATAFNAVTSLLDQSYTGDINIFPGFGILSLARILKTPSEDEIRDILLAGERATWPKVATIRTTTSIGRALDEVMDELGMDPANPSAVRSKKPPMKKRSAKKAASKSKTGKTKVSKKKVSKSSTAKAVNKPVAKSARRKLPANRVKKRA